MLSKNILGEEHYEIVAFHDKGDKAFLLTGPGGTIERISKSEAVPMAEKARQASKDRVGRLIEGLIHGLP